MDVGQLAVVRLTLTNQSRLVCGAVAVTVNLKRVMIAGFPATTSLYWLKSLPGVVLARSAAVTSMGMAAGMVWTVTVMAALREEDIRTAAIKKALRFIVILSILGKGAEWKRKGGRGGPPFRSRMSSGPRS
jgi:hypothetical protein